MQACGKVRDRDVAMALLGQAGVAADAPLMGRLAEQRQAAEAELRRELRQWSERGWQRKWRARLEV
jgi:CHAD domain-containing protein